MKTAYLGLGSNLANKRANVRKAIQLIRTIKCLKVISVSGLYRTEPWGYKDQPSFLNAAVKIETSLSPLKLLLFLKGIEKKMGRKSHKIKWGPRIIDIDILLYGMDKLKNRTLQIPHPGMHERTFVLGPLAEIAPRAVHPVLKKTIKKLLKEFTTESRRHRGC